MAGAALVVPVQWATGTAGAASPLVKKWRDRLVVPPFVTAKDVSLRLVTSSHSFHSSLPAGPTLAYQADGHAATSYLGPTIVATTGEQTTVTATNEITSHPLAASLDREVHGTLATDAATPRTAVHLHGGNTSPSDDGGPLDTFPSNHKGEPGSSNPYQYTYGNTQDAAGIWYHDHALGITRLNVYAGLAAGYIIRDKPAVGTTPATGIDTGDGVLLPPPWPEEAPYEVPLVIQDKTLNPDGSMLYDPAPWVPEFFGDTAVVNGTAYPFMDVDRGVYRFRVYNGSNARFYRLSLKVKATGAQLPFWQIGSDGGLLDAPVSLTQLLVSPGERADLLVDFRSLAAGALVEMGNNAVTPFPSGPTAARKGGVPLPQIMQFRVGRNSGWTPRQPIATMDLRPGRHITRLDALAADPEVRIRTHSLVEIMDAAGNVMMATLNNRTFDDEEYQLDPVRPNTLEVWEFVNTTVDAHPIHLHLVQFQVLNRQAFNSAAYLQREYGAGMITPNTGPTTPVVPGESGPAPRPTAADLLGGLQPPAPNERGWKDTVQAPPGMVTRIAVPFGAFPGVAEDQLAARNVFATSGADGYADYVWHCHILEHEDNDMMQRYRIQATGS